MNEFPIVILSLAGWVFVASCTAKLSSRRAYRSFRDGLAQARLIPVRLLPIVAAGLAGTELAAAAGLLAAAGLTAASAPGADWLAESALAVAAALLGVLAVGVALVVRRGTQARCACFGARSSRPLGPVHLARNLSLLAVAAAGLVATPIAHSRPPLTGATLAAAAGAVAALLFIRWEDLAGLFAPIPPSATAVPGASGSPRARRPARGDS